MNDTYPSLIDIHDEISKHSFDYTRLSEDRIMIFGPMGAVKYSRQADNTWAKDRAGF